LVFLDSLVGHWFPVKLYFRVPDRLAAGDLKRECFQVEMAIDDLDDFHLPAGLDRLAE